VARRSGRTGRVTSASTVEGRPRRSRLETRSPGSRRRHDPTRLGRWRRTPPRHVSRDRRRRREHPPARSTPFLPALDLERRRASPASSPGCRPSWTSLRRAYPRR
jgi:hypothetical protein